MPLKVCKSCGEKAGVRTKICPKCQTSFVKNIPEEKPTKQNKKKKDKSAIPPREIISMGAWILDKYKGMPEIEIPPPLPKGKLTVEEIRNYISFEGLGFCVQQYIDAGKIADVELAKLWVKTREKLKEIVEYVY